MNAAVAPFRSPAVDLLLPSAAAGGDDWAAALAGGLPAVRLESPLPASSPCCVLVHGFLSPAECRRLIALSEARGFDSANTDYPPSYRNNERQVLTAPHLAERLFVRLRGVAPQALAFPDATPQGINERFRLCRYRPGQEFRLHQDGVHFRPDGTRSRLTFMIYLSEDGAFTGGDTLFFTGGPGSAGPGDPPLLARVRPRQGTLIVFDHALWHSGATVTAGYKHLLRSDLLYREAAVAAAPQPFEPAHRGYVWTLARLADGRIASGGRDTAIRLWTAAGASAGMLPGHAQSVLGLAPLPDGRLVSISRDRTLRWWHPDRGCTRVVEAAHAAAGLCVVPLPDGSVVSGGADGLIHHWADCGQRLATLSGHTGWVWALAADGDDTVVSASEDGSVRVWSLAGGAAALIHQQRAPFRCLAVVGGELFAGDADGTNVHLIRRGGLWQLQASWPAHAAAVRAIASLGDGRLASAGEDGQVKVWRLADRACIHQAAHQNFATAVLPLAGGQLLSCAYDGVIRRHVVAG